MDKVWRKSYLAKALRGWLWLSCIPGQRILSMQILSQTYVPKIIYEEVEDT